MKVQGPAFNLVDTGFRGATWFNFGFATGNPTPKEQTKLRLLGSYPVNIPFHYIYTANLSDS